MHSEFHKKCRNINPYFLLSTDCVAEASDLEGKLRHPDSDKLPSLKGWTCTLVLVPGLLWCFPAVACAWMPSNAASTLLQAPKSAPYVTNQLRWLLNKEWSSGSPPSCPPGWWTSLVYRRSPTILLLKLISAICILDLSLFSPWQIEASFAPEKVRS